MEDLWQFSTNTAEQVFPYNDLHGHTLTSSHQGPVPYFSCFSFLFSVLEESSGVLRIRLYQLLHRLCSSWVVGDKLSFCGEDSIAFGSGFCNRLESWLTRDCFEVRQMIQVVSLSVEKDILEGKVV